MRYIRLELDAAYIELTKGQEATVDLADVPLLAQYRWHATPNAMGGYYAATCAPGSFSPLYMHRLILGAPKGRVVDHENHDTLDNRRSNLRLCGQRENLQNRRTANSNSTTGIRGVYIHHVKDRTYYNARHMVDGKSKTKNFPHTDEGKVQATAWAMNQRGEQ